METILRWGKGHSIGHSVKRWRAQIWWSCIQHRGQTVHRSHILRRNRGYTLRIRGHAIESHILRRKRIHAGHWRPALKWYGVHIGKRRYILGTYWAHRIHTVSRIGRIGGGERGGGGGREYCGQIKAKIPTYLRVGTENERGIERFEIKVKPCFRYGTESYKKKRIIQKKLSI